ncbi:unnamed protein product [Peronospora farinosa]|uniref:HECT-type E3 ubiquitin transferase n=1 Tax=Peronospora farinosa TaxID=134698 RepID=A0ABN8C0P9_9STRA|nr:unnamed protein product [Peronospora farinosa]
MFLRDNELTRGSDGNRRNDRVRVLELASKEAGSEKSIEGAGNGDVAFAGKVSDIANLKVIVQQPTLALPYDVLFELLRLVLYFYTGRGEDAERLLKLSSLFVDALAGALDGVKEIMEKQREWQLRRLIDLCLQCNALNSAIVDISVGFKTVRALTGALPEMQRYLLSGQLLFFHPMQQARKMLYSELPYTTVTLIVRQGLISARGHLPISSRAKTSVYCNALVDFVVHLLTATGGILKAFVMEVFSVPLLNQVSGITSEAWFLGNILWISERVENKPDSIVLSEVRLLSKLLQSVPPATYSASGVAVTWTKVSESHSVPVVFPEALNEQLQVLVNDHYLRSMCNHLLSFSPSALRHPLATQRPTAMYPEAPTVAEQFGFGDIASTSPISLSLSVTWQKVKSIGKSTWARSLFEKTGLRRGRESEEDTGTGGISQLQNTSKEARKIAVNNVDGLKKSTPLQQAGALKLASSSEPFIFENIEALSCLCGTFLFRWGLGGEKRQSYAMRLLNTLAFYHVEVVESAGNTIQSVSFVHMLWCVLQDTKNFEDFTKNVDLIHARSSDPYVCMLVLFCMSYEHLLVVMDDEEMYAQEYPLPLCQIERIVLSLKHALHEAYWTYANLAPSSESVSFGMFVVEMGTRLMRVLYNRCSRQPFCNVTSWIIAKLDSNQLIEEVLIGTPRANKLIQSMPYLVPFPDRVKLFQRLIKADKEIHQNDRCSVYRIRIRRGAILEDGLRKLNTIRTSLKKRINVVFVNAAGREEVGIDAGGLFKEFWLDLSTLAFDLQYGLFLTTHDQLLYPNPNSASSLFTRESDHLTMFQFVGRILGKALYEGILVQPKFAHFFLSKLLHSFNQLNELPSLDPEIYKNLMFLKSYDGDVEDLGLTHTVVHDVFGEQKEIEIIPDGGNIPVTSQNKTRYIHLVANYYLNTQIREQCSAFRMGMSDLIDPRWLQMFNEPELQVLISGKSGKIDIDDLKANSRYAGGYYALDKRVAWLWQALASFTPSEQAAFLRFTTSCQRAPSLGFASLTPQFCVQKIPIRSDDELLPSSSTCFNTLKLPTYSSYKVLRSKLLTSISSGAGFEMT